MKRLRSLLLAGCLSAALAGAADAGTLTVAQGFDPSTLWPNGTTNAETYNVGTPIVESLFWLDPHDLQIKPLLALSYTEESPTSIVVNLRPGVKFSNGEPMNADAVIHSFNILIDAKQTPAYTRYFEMFASAEKIDDLTVRMISKYAIPTMPVTLTLFFVVPPGYWNEVGLEAYGSNPIGTGPFLLESWVRDSEVVMRANPDYWGEAPAGIDRLVFRPVPDDTVRAAGAMTGEVDIAKNMAISSLPELEGQANLSVLSVDSYAIYTVIMSALEEHDAPFRDVRVRQAMQYAVDKDAIRQHILFDRVVPLNGQVLRRTQLGYNPDLADYPYDPAKARELLAEAGYPNGFDTHFKFPVGRYAQGQEVVEAVVGMLADVGVNATIEAIEPGEYLRQLRAREFTALALSGSAPPDDPHFFLSQYHSTWRYSYIRNDELDALIDAGKMELDVEKRGQIYREAMVLMRELSPSIYLYGGVDFFAVSNRVKNFAARGDGRYFFYGVSLEE